MVRPRDRRWWWQKTRIKTICLAKTVLLRLVAGAGFLFWQRFRAVHAILDSSSFHSRRGSLPPRGRWPERLVRDQRRRFESSRRAFSTCPSPKLEIIDFP